MQFLWIGNGNQRDALIVEAARRRLKNLSFPGAFTRTQVAEEMRTADVFVMPSLSEGVPKSTQEAAACGVPCVVFGFYEPGSVIDGGNGYLVWSDVELQRRLGELLESPPLCAEMGRHGYEISRAWDWDKVAKQWEQTLLGIIQSF